MTDKKLLNLMSFPFPHLRAHAFKQYTDVAKANKEYTSARSLAVACMRPGKPLEGFNEDEITWEHVQAVRESMKQAQKPSPTKLAAQDRDGVMIVDDQDATAAAAAPPSTPAAAAAAAAGHHTNGKRGAARDDLTDLDQQERKKRQPTPATTALTYPVTPNQLAKLTVQQLKKTPLALWPLKELQTLLDDISGLEAMLHTELVTETRKIKAYKEQISWAKSLVINAYAKAEMDLTAELETDAVGGQFLADVVQLMTHGKAQAEQLANNLLNSDGHNAMTATFFTLQNKVNAIRECKAEVHRAIALEQDADDQAADAHTGENDQGFHVPRSVPRSQRARAMADKEEETSHATQCTTATGATGTSLRRLFSWGRSGV